MTRSGYPRGTVASLVVLVVLAVGCASTDVAPIERPREVDGAEYLVAPTESLGVELSAESRAAIRRASEAIRFGDLSVGRELARSLLSPDGEELARQILLAQADFVEAQYSAVVERLEELVRDRPALLAAQLVLGRAAELADLPVVANRAFRAVADRSPLASRRAQGVHVAATARLSDMAADALERGDLEVAGSAVDELLGWEPDDFATLELARRLLRARGDLAGELELVRRMASDEAAPRSVLERLGRLELDLGEPRVGLEIFEGLAERYPTDPVIVEGLASARFAWRLRLLPEEVQELLGAPTLSRGDFAELLFWMVPAIRTTRASGGRIASDILEDPRRDAIARVVNLEVMDNVDNALHRFAPDGALRRRDVATVLLRIQDRFGQGCSATTGRDVCGAALACGVLRDDGWCEAGGDVAGGDVRDPIRKALE